MKKSELRQIIKRVIYEVTIKDLRSDAPNFLNVRAKSKYMPVEFVSVEGPIINFQVKSQSKDIYYHQQIKLVNLLDYIELYKDTLKPKEIVNKAMKSDVLVHCDDPSWKYWGFQYKGTIEKYALEPETISPKTRNPNLKGSVCKHLDSVLQVLPMYVNTITGELKKQGLFK